jgi:hypothetical protein
MYFLKDLLKLCIGTYIIYFGKATFSVMRIIMQISKNTSLCVQYTLLYLNNA